MSLKRKLQKQNRKTGSEDPEQNKVVAGRAPGPAVDSSSLAPGAPLQGAMRPRARGRRGSRFRGTREFCLLCCSFCRPNYLEIKKKKENSFFLSLFVFFFR